MRFALNEFCMIESLLERQDAHKNEERTAYAKEANDVSCCICIGSGMQLKRLCCRAVE